MCKRILGDDPKFFRPEPDQLEMEICMRRGSLPPCPFCGSDKILLSSRLNKESNIWGAEVFCTGSEPGNPLILNCMARVHSTPSQTREEAQQSALERWKRRAPAFEPVTLSLEVVGTYTNWDEEAATPVRELTVNFDVTDVPAPLEHLTLTQLRGIWEVCCTQFYQGIKRDSDDYDPFADEEPREVYLSLDGVRGQEITSLLRHPLVLVEK